MSSITPAAASGQNVPTLSTLPNGLQVLAMEDHRFPLIAMRLYVHAGAAYEHDGEAGISHLLEHMAFKGAEEVADAAQRIEDVGGSLNAATGYDHTVYMVDVPGPEWALGLEVLHDLAMTHGPLLENELETEKQVVLSELDGIREHPRRRLFEMLQKQVWAGTPYERPVIGNPETIQALGAKDIQTYLERLYHPQAMLLVLCGDFEYAQVAETIGDRFGSPVAPQAVHIRPVSTFTAGQRTEPDIRVERAKWEKAYIGFGFPLPAMHSVAAPALEILAYILGGHRSSRWYVRFKEELGLVEDISVETVLMEGVGMFLVQVQLDADKVYDFWRQWLQDLLDLDKSPGTSQELERAILNIEDGLHQTKETLSGLSSKLGYFQFFDRQVAAEERYVHNLRRIQVADLTAMIQTYLRPEDLHVCSILPDEAEIGESDLQATWRELAGPAADRPGRGKGDSARPKGVQVVDIGNQGTLVIQVDRTLPYTALDLSFNGGDMLVAPEEQGLNTLLAKTLLRGAAGWSGPDIQAFLSSKAASLNCHAGRDQLSVVSKFPTRFTSEMVDLIRRILEAPDFCPDEIHKAVSEQQAQIGALADHPMGTLSREIFPFLFPGHCLGYYLLGHRENLSRFTPEMIAELWKRQCRRPWVLSVCGDCDPEIFEQMARTLPDHRPSHRHEAPGCWDERPPAWNPTQSLHLPLNDRQQAHVLVIFPVPGLSDSSNASISLLKNVLAGQNGLLFRELRDKRGLGYSVAPMLWRIPGLGFLAFYIGTTPDSVGAAQQGFADVVDMVQAGQLTSRDLSRAQRLLEVEYYRERQTLASRCSEAADLLSYGLGLDYFQHMLGNSRQVGIAHIQEAAERYLVWDAAYTIVLGPEDEHPCP